jgi:electron transport complex protein RnfC
VVVHNPATALAVHEALRHGRPLVARVMTVSGGAISRPTNLRVPLGTPLQHLIDHCEGFRVEPTRLISGGPMMGQPLPSMEVPVVKGTSGILALTQKEAAIKEAMPCIRCGSCVTACPCGLLPLEMASRARAGDLDGAASYGLTDCVSCGSCSYVCPAHIPLVQYFNYAKGALTEQQRAKHKQDETKRLAEARNERMEKIKQAKKEMMAKRKAEAAAKKAKQKAEAEAAEEGSVDASAKADAKANAKDGSVEENEKVGT